MQVGCAAGSLAQGEPMAGFAPAFRTWVMVEHPGPWGRHSVLDAAWPADLGRQLQAAATAAGVRLMLGRRYRSRPNPGLPDRPSVVIAHVGPAGWAITRRLDDVAELRRLPMAQAADGIRPDRGWRRCGPIWAVCTHGTRDACCARLGRPLAAALHERAPRGTWETSHTGGHRFAGALIELPAGLAYGRVPVDRAGELIDAAGRDEVVVDLLRGRCDLDHPRQAADVALRRELGLAGRGEVIPDGAQQLPGGTWVTWWRAAGRRWRVDVGTRPVPPRSASCGDVAEASTVWDPRVVGPA